MKNTLDFNQHGQDFDPMKTFQNIYEVSACLTDLRSKFSHLINSYNLEFKEMNRKCTAYMNLPEVSRFELEYFQAKNTCNHLADEIKSVWDDIIKCSEVYERFINRKIDHMSKKLDEVNKNDK